MTLKRMKHYGGSVTVLRPVGATGDDAKFVQIAQGEAAEYTDQEIEDIAKTPGYTILAVDRHGRTVGDEMGDPDPSPGDGPPSETGPDDTDGPDDANAKPARGRKKGA